MVMNMIKREINIDLKELYEEACREECRRKIIEVTDEIIRMWLDSDRRILNKLVDIYKLLEEKNYDDAIKMLKTLITLLE